MTIYTNADSTTVGSIGDYYNDYIYRNSTTSYSNRTNYTAYFNDKTNWDYYSTTGTTSSTYLPYIGIYIKPQVIREVKPSKEELLRREEERLKAVEEAKKAREEAEEAARKARVLLTEYLDDENLQRLLNKQPLEVSSGLFSDVKYHIPISNYGRIKALKNDKIITELCLAVQDSRNLPTDDIILAKMLHVLHDEENMLRTANHFNNKDENLLRRLN